MRIISRKYMLCTLLTTVVFISTNGCAMPQRPTIRVAIGMTVDELREGSTYPFGASPPNTGLGSTQETQSSQALGVNDWVITQPYDLVYTYKDCELKEFNLGGSNYLLAITTSPMKKIFIDHLQITFQNHSLTLDEALAITRRLNDWFVACHFHPLSRQDPEPGRIVEPFHIERQESQAPRYDAPIRNYNDLQVGFLDPHAKIVSVTPFELEADDAYVSAEIVNSRRQREDGEMGDESNAKSESGYFVNLSISARPSNRYWDVKLSPTAAQKP